MRHRERVLPPWWLYVVCALVVPASILVFLPIEPAWGVAVGVVLLAGSAAVLVARAPVVEVADGTLRAGQARIPVAALGEAAALDRAASRAALGTGFDARAYLCTVPWVRTLVRVDVADELDPTSAWLISSRRGAQLVAAIEAERR